MPKEVIKAEELAKKQREISISEFFLKNRHLLGFDNPTRALMMVVKEAVDNSLDACTEMKVLPEIKIELKEINENRFIVIVEDNGPGIVKQQIPNIFGKLLYGSKFHSLKMNRGQQGLGISAAVLYSQLTTGKSTKIYSRVSPNKPSHYFELQIDTKKNDPSILEDKETKWDKDHGTKIEIEIEGRYLKGKQSVDEYVKETAIVNPHATFIYITPEKEKFEYKRVTDELPIEPKEIKPHPYGIELGHLIKMLQDTRANTLSGFLQSDFSRIGSGTAKEICDKAKIKTERKPKSLEEKEIELLFKSLQETKIMAPPSDCLSPIKAELLEKGLRKEINADFYVT
ncbi:MAG: DNA topoisomerase VI subunit B, partial [Nanoarchaeota archaeon]